MKKESTGLPIYLPLIEILKFMLSVWLYNLCNSEFEINCILQDAIAQI